MNFRFYSISFLMILTSFAGKGQNILQGKYEYSFGDYNGSSGTKIYFLNNAKFKYYAFDCMAHQIGKGNYALIKNKLILNFIRTDTFETIFNAIPTKPQNNLVTYKLKIKHRDLPVDSLQKKEMVVITLKTRTKDTMIMEATDEYGNYFFETENSSETITFEIVPNENYKPIKINKSLKEGFDAEILLAENCNECANINKIEYDVIAINRKELILTNNGKRMIFKREN